MISSHCRSSLPPPPIAVQLYSSRSLPDYHKQNFGGWGVIPVKGVGWEDPYLVSSSSSSFSSSSSSSSSKYYYGCPLRIGSCSCAFSRFFDLKQFACDSRPMQMIHWVTLFHMDDLVVHIITLVGRIFTLTNWKTLWEGFTTLFTLLVGHLCCRAVVDEIRWWNRFHYLYCPLFVLAEDLLRTWRVYLFPLHSVLWEETGSEWFHVSCSSSSCRKRRRKRSFPCIGVGPFLYELTSSSCSLSRLIEMVVLVLHSFFTFPFTFFIFFLSPPSQQKQQRRS